MIAEEALTDSDLSSMSGSVSQTSPDKPRSLGQSITHGALALVLLQSLTWSATLVSTIVGPRMMGSNTLGQLAIAITINTIVSTIAGLGIPEFLVRRAAQQPATLRRDQGIALTIQLCFACTGFALVAI